MAVLASKGRPVTSVAWLTSDIAVVAGQTVPGGCTYYRCLLPMRSLGVEDQVIGRPAWTGQHGFGVQIPGNRARMDFDVVVLKLLWDRSLAYQIKVAKSLGQRVVIDVDDLYEGLHADNIASTAIDEKRQRAHDNALAQASAITVSTPYLFDLYKDRYPEVHMIRNGIDPDRYPVRAQSLTPKLGWAGAIPWRSADLETMAPWLGAFMDHYGLRLHHHGHIPDRKTFAELADIPDRLVDTAPMCSIYNYPARMPQFDIGLVPLNDIPFNQAKSFLKGMEYIAAGIPFVAEALPEYRILAEDGIGQVASTQFEWVSALTELLDLGPKGRGRLASRQRAIMTKLHGYETRAPQWRKALLPQSG